MSIVILRLPVVKRKTEKRLHHCPHCQGEILQRWGRVNKPVRDKQFRSVQIYHYRCWMCRRTLRQAQGKPFRHYPEGVDRPDQAQRLRKIAAICWALGLSLRSVALILDAFGVSLRHMTVWRDLQEQASLLSQKRRWQKVRVLGLDGAYPLGWGKKQPVLIAVDLGNGQPVAIAQIDESNPQAVHRFLQPLVQRSGVSAIVTNYLASFRKVAEKIGFEHQVCQPVLDGQSRIPFATFGRAGFA